MKRIKLLSIFMVFVTFMGVVSCDTEPVDPLLLVDSDDDPDTEVPASFKVDFSEQTFVATTTQAMINDGMIGIYGVKGTNGEAVSILIDGTTTGNYTNAYMDYTPTLASSGYYENIDPAIAGGEGYTGSVNITSINTVTRTISGTFNFVGYWSVTAANQPRIAFTNGSFTNIPYTNNAIPGQTDHGDEYFTAKVNDVLYDYLDGVFSVGETSGGVVNYITLNGTDDGNGRLVVSIKSDVTQGTYPISSGATFGEFRARYFTDFDTPDELVHEGTTGTLTIISNDDGWIKGTFQFTDGATLAVTSGTFNIEVD